MFGWVFRGCTCDYNRNNGQRYYVPLLLGQRTYHSTHLVYMRVHTISNIMINVANCTIYNSCTRSCTCMHMHTCTHTLSQTHANRYADISMNVRMHTIPLCTWMSVECVHFPIARARGASVWWEKGHCRSHSTADTRRTLIGERQILCIIHK